MVNNLFVIISACIASTGFWQFIQFAITKYTDKHTKEDETMTIERQAILGLLHNEIYPLCNKYIHDGKISADDYDNLLYLYKPYIALNGNGTCKKLMNEVEHLHME